MAPSPVLVATQQPISRFTMQSYNQPFKQLHYPSKIMTSNTRPRGERQPHYRHVYAEKVSPVLKKHIAMSDLRSGYPNAKSPFKTT